MRTGIDTTVKNGDEAPLNVPLRYVFRSLKRLHSVSDVFVEKRHTKYESRYTIQSQYHRLAHKQKNLQWNSVKTMCLRLAKSPNYNSLQGHTIFYDELTISSVDYCHMKLYYFRISMARLQCKQRTKSMSQCLQRSLPERNPGNLFTKTLEASTSIRIIYYMFLFRILAFNLLHCTITGTA